MVNIKDLKNLSSSLSILYVEDDRDIANTVINYLSKIFDNVIYLENGKAALNIYSEDLLDLHTEDEKSTFDIVITDINMPEMNGLTLAKEIKKLNPKQSIIFMTAHSEKEIFLEAIKIGVDGYIMKPIDLSQINELLYKVSTNIKNSYENMINQEQQTFLMNHISEKNILLKQYTDVIDKVAIISRADLTGKITYVNDLFCEISGYKRDELLGKEHNIIRHPDMNPSIYAEMWDTIKKGKVWEGTIKNLAKNGNPYFVHATIIPEIEDKKIVSYIGIRFLSTNEEVEKREFKKKVRTSIQEYKKTNYELSIKVEELSSELTQRRREKDSNIIKVADLEKKLEKALFEVKHYEKAFTKKEETKYDSIKNYKKNLNEITLKYQNMSKELNTKKSELTKIKTDNEEKKEELLKLNEEIIDQQKIILDLRDALKNNTTEKKVENDSSKKNIFDIFK